MYWRLGEKGCNQDILEDRDVELTCDYFRTRKLKELFHPNQESAFPLMQGVTLMAGEKIFRSFCAWFFVRCQHSSPWLLRRQQRSCWSRVGCTQLQLCPRQGNLVSQDEIRQI